MYYKIGTVSNDKISEDNIKSVKLSSAPGGAASTLLIKNAAGTEIYYLSVLAGDSNQDVMPGAPGQGFHIGIDATITITGDSNTRVRID